MFFLPKKLFFYFLFFLISFFLFFPVNEAWAAGRLAGINIDPSNPVCWPSAERLKALGASQVRLEYKPGTGFDYDGYINSLNQAGVDVLMILDQSMLWPDGFNEDYVEEFSVEAQRIAKKYGNKVAGYQIWNEPDLSDRSTSIALTSEQYAALLTATYNSIKRVSGAYIATAGLASGNVEYLKRLIAAAGGTPFDYVGVHPYIPNAAGVVQAVGNYLRNSGGKPVLISEFGWETANQKDQAAYLSAVYQALAQTYGNQVAFAFWFAFTDGMVAGFGLLDTNCNPKEAYRAFQNIAGVPSLPPPVGPPQYFPVPPFIPSLPQPAPAGTCVAGTGRPPSGDLRPEPCSDCQTKVSKPVDSCMDTAIIKTEGKFKLNALKLCDEGRYGVWDWNTQFSLNTEKTLVPFAGYREILPAFENQQKYLADYFEGVALYDGKTPKPGEEQNFVMRSGVWRKLAPQAIQDDYKIKMIQKGHDYKVTDGEGHSLTMQAYGQSFYPAGNLPPERDKPDYLSLRADWEKTVYGQLWPYVPMFSREDTPGKIVATIENPPGELQKTTPEAREVSETTVEFPVTFPHIKRLYEVTQALQKLLLPAESGSAQAAAPVYLAANQLADKPDQPDTPDRSAGQVLAAADAPASDTGCYGIRIALENKEGSFVVHAWDSNPETCGSTLVDPTIRVTWVKTDASGHSASVGGCTLTASPDFRGFPRDNGDPNNHGTPITDLQGCQAPISPADLGNDNRLEVNLTVVNAGGANDPSRGCFQTASCTCTLKLTSEGPVQNCAGGQQVIVTEEKTCPGQNSFSPDTCLKNAISDPNPKLDPACCSDTAKVVVNDYWHYLKSNDEWCSEIKDKCCNDDDYEARQSCKNHICAEPERYGSCPWETATLYRKVRFDVKIPYLEKIWDQIGNVADNLEEITKKTGIFTVLKPAAFPRYAEKYARSEINYDLTSQPQVKGKTPDYGPETAPGEISPQKADFYFPFLGGAELTKQWFVNSLLPKKLQNPAVANPFGAPLAVTSGNETPPAESCPALTYTIDLGNTNIKDLLNSRKNAILTYVDASWPSNQLEENWDKLLNAAVSKDFNPAFLMTLYIEESGAGGTSANDAFGCLPGEKKTFDESLTCFFEKSVSYKQYKNDFAKFMLAYSSLADLNRGCFATNPGFPANIKSVYERVTGQTL